jgi:fatty acid desaturase
MSHISAHAPAPHHLEAMSPPPPRPRPPAIQDPRAAMAARLPGWLQPFLTRLTAKPAPGEAPRGEVPGHRFVLAACAWTAGGVALSLLPFLLAEPSLLAWVLLLPLGLLATSSGLGLFQVVVFHHCSHGTVFATRARNRTVGRLVSALLLFKRFEDYQRGHMLHHSPNKLLTEEDEFADFVLGLMRLRAGTPRRTLWRRVLVSLVSPAFHARFLAARLRGAMRSGDRAHDWTSRLAWGGAVAAAAATGTLVEFALVWVLPATVLLQQATVFRILCEHRFPEPAVIEARGKGLVVEAPMGVFPGVMPPAARAATACGLAAWTLWWLQMLTVQLFVRLFMLVGDVPCHDFHHRRPGTRRWNDYAHAREADAEAGSPGFPGGYTDVWGLFRAVDMNLTSLAAAPPPPQTAEAGCSGSRP